MKTSQLAVLLSAGLLIGIPRFAQSQGGYSIAGANRYVAQKDWRDLLAYTQAWTKTNPNDAMAWYYLAQTTASATTNRPTRQPRFDMRLRYGRSGPRPGMPWPTP